MVVDGVLMSVSRSKAGQFSVYLPVKVLRALGWSIDDGVSWSWDDVAKNMYISRNRSFLVDSNVTKIFRFNQNSFKTTIPRAIAVAMGFKHKSKALLILDGDKILFKRAVL